MVDRPILDMHMDTSFSPAATDFMPPESAMVVGAALRSQQSNWRLIASRRLTAAAIGKLLRSR
jgi:hypothetical protein